MKHDERHATWLELFFDLVFVAAVTTIAHRLGEPQRLFELLLNLALFIPIWWAWLGHTVYANRFPSEDLAFHVLTYTMMLGAATMAVQLPRFPANGGGSFAVAYCVSRISLLVLYGRIRPDPPVRYLRGLYLKGFGLGASLWLLSLWVHPPERYLIWLVGMGVELATPWAGRAGLQHAPLNVSHLPERMGLFTLIVLGESVVSVVSGLTQHPWSGATVAVALLAFTMAVSVWASYVSFVEATSFERSLGSGQPYLYGHLPLVLGLTVLAAGIARAIAEATQTLSTQTTGLMLTGTILWFGSFWGLKFVSHTGSHRFAEVLSCGATMVILAFGTQLPAWSLMVGLAAIFGAAAWHEVSQHQRRILDPATERPTRGSD